MVEAVSEVRGPSERLILQQSKLTEHAARSLK